MVNVANHCVLNKGWCKFMEFEVGKKYINQDRGIAIEIVGVSKHELVYVVIDGDNPNEPVGERLMCGKESMFAKGLKPYANLKLEAENEPALIKEYDYFRLPLHTQYLHSYINAFLRIYNTVSIQKTADYYILQCERLEKE